MASSLTNYGLGRWKALYERVKNGDPSTSRFVVMLLKAAEADATLVDRLSFTAILGAAGNTEANFSGYARVVHAAADLSAVSAPDSTADTSSVYYPNLQWGPTVGAPTDNAIAKAIIGYEATTGAADTAIYPIWQLDFVRASVNPSAALVMNAAGLCLGKSLGQTIT